MADNKTVWKKFRELTSSRRFWELAPPLLLVFLLPFLHGGETELAKIMFLAFPVFYIPILWWKKRRIDRSFKLVFWAWIVYLSVNLMSIPSSISIALSVPQFMELVGMFVYFLMFYLVIEKESDLRLMSNLIVLVGFVLSVIALYFIAYPPPLTFPGMNLVWAKFGKNHLADYLLFVLPVVVMQFLTVKNQKDRILWGTLVGYFLFHLLLTFSRGAMLVFAMSLPVIFKVPKPTNKLRRKLLFPLAFLPLAALLSLVLFSQIKSNQGNFDHIPVMQNWLLRQVYKPLFKEPRSEYWRQAIEGFKLRPILGNGVGSYRLTSRRFSKSMGDITWFALNYPLQELTETGVLGLVSFIALLLALAYRLVKVSKLSSTSKGLLVGALSALALSLVDFNFDFLAIQLIFWLVIASVLAVYKNGKRLKKLLSFTLTGLACLGLIYVGFNIVGFFWQFKAQTTKYQDKALTEDFYKRAIKTFPFSEELRLISLEFSSKNNLSFSPLNLAITFNKQDPRILKLVADIFWAKDEVDHAIELYEKAIKFEPTFSDDYTPIIRSALQQDQLNLVQVLTNQIFKNLERAELLDGYFDYQFKEQLAILTKKLADKLFVDDQISIAANYYVLAQEISPWTLNKFPPVFVNLIEDKVCGNKWCPTFELDKSLSPQNRDLLAKEILKSERGKYGYLPDAFSTLCFQYLVSLIEQNRFNDIEEVFDVLGKISFADKEFYWNKVFDVVNQQEKPVFLASLVHRYVEVKYLNYKKRLSLAKELYFLGLEAYRNGDINLAIEAWENSSWFAPEWSFFQVELANLYYLLGDYHKAEAQIELCMKNSWAERHCREFWGLLNTDRTPEPIGFMQERISSYVKTNVDKDFSRSL